MQAGGWQRCGTMGPAAAEAQDDDSRRRGSLEVKYMVKYAETMAVVEKQGTMAVAEDISG